MRVVIYALAKNEELYINHWVEHHLKLGVDKIYLVDNNDPGKMPLINFIDFKYRNKIEVEDYRGVHKDKLQHYLYTKFYQEHNNEFDWCIFIDIDEFIFGIDDIHLWLESPQFRYAKQIRIKWKLFGDDDMIIRNVQIPVYKAFTKEVTSSLNRNLIDKGNLEKQGKSIVRGGLLNVVIRSPHFASVLTRDNVIPSVLPSGRPCYSKVVINEDYSHETVFIHHYMTKTLSEFIRQKLNRTDAVFGDLSIKLDYFWRVNKKTPEKIEYLRGLGLWQE